MRPVFTWNLGSRSLELGKRTVVMGIVNVTPDSFSDGGEHSTPEAAVAHALKLHEDGADILDIGGESTRPGAKVGFQDAAVDQKEELRRVLPVIVGIKKAQPEAIVSIDTYKAGVAKAAVQSGAEIVNDGSGLTWDREMAAISEKLVTGCSGLWAPKLPPRLRALTLFVLTTSKPAGTLCAWRTSLANLPGQSFRLKCAFSVVGLRRTHALPVVCTHVGYSCGADSRGTFGSSLPFAKP